MALLLANSTIWDSVLEVTKVYQEKGSDPLEWAVYLSSNLASSGVSLPSPELANVLVSHICWENNTPIAWKFLDKAFSSNIVPPLLTLALLSQRIIPCRQTRPSAYRLYMELVKRHALTPKNHIHGVHFQKVMDSIDNVLHFSKTFGIEANEPGILLVEYIFSTVWQLLDASLDDEGLLELTPEKKSKWVTKSQDMDVYIDENYTEKRIDIQERLRNSNTVMAVDLVGQFLLNKVTSRILYLARQNMPRHWGTFVQRIQLLLANSSALINTQITTASSLLQLTSDSPKISSRKRKISSTQYFSESMACGPTFSSSSGLCHGVSRSTLWLPLDMALEDAMDGTQVNTTSAVEIISGLMRSLQALNGTTWHESFLGLWMAALRLVQRESDPIEGPVPRLDTRLCMLLTITTLVVVDLIEHEDDILPDHEREKCRADLVSSLQVLGDYKRLLTPPQSVISAANMAVAKAMMFVSGNNSVGNPYLECISLKDVPSDCSGNMHHLIVEACIARNLIDTSAYFWPGYVNSRRNQMPHNMPVQAGWSSFMKGGPLTQTMIKALVSTPASSLGEVEKVFEIAIKGSNDDRIAAATILCGASFIRGWNIQEHTIYFITRLLSPPIPADYTGTDSHLISYAPMLNVLLTGIAPVDCVQIFSLHGLIPQLAASLMPICEVFGSCVPNVSWTLPTGEEISAHAVFSNAFALLLKLWRFNSPPLEHGVGDVPPVGYQLTPEYILCIRNSQLKNTQNKKPIFLDMFPKLKLWYLQHQACIASPLSGLVHGTPVHHIVDVLLDMMFRKANRVGHESITTVTSGTSSSSSGLGNEENRPILAAWDVLEAVPFVVDAALTACANGRLTPRELCTGLKDLADYLPASLVCIVSYFSAEVTRGIWKPVFMNGTDWPSPAANLSNVEEIIKKILAATGVDVPSLAAGGSSPASLPLPLAAFVSLTITYKLDKVSQRFLNLAGPALESLAAGCPWPCMPIVASLWTQKAKRWSDYLVFSASRTVFLHNNDAVVQLLKSCFTATLSGSVGSLFGHGFGSHFCGGISPVAPGILYLRVYRSIRYFMFLREEIISLLMQSVSDVARSATPNKLNKTIRYGHVSLAAAMTRVKLAASLGASIVWLSGGSALVQSLINETLPSWFLSVPNSEKREETGGMVAMLKGYALAYFAMFCGAFAWGVDSSSSASKRRYKILGAHLEFVASALDGKISLGCDCALWRAYVFKFLSLMTTCTPSWVPEIDVTVLERLSKGLRQWDEEELAFVLLAGGGIRTVSIATKLIMVLGE